MVQKLVARAGSLFHAAWLRAIGVTLGRGVRVHGPVRILGDPRRITVGDRCSIHRGVTFWTHDYGPGHGRIILGRSVTLLTDVVLNSMVSISIGDEAALGHGCYLQDNDHGTEPGLPVMRQPSHGSAITIGQDVWFGARCIVLKGVTVGDGTVVGAGAVVARSLPPGVVAVGTPARPVRQRGGAALRTA